MPHSDSSENNDWSITEWDSNLRKIEQHLRTVYNQDGAHQWVATFYEKGTIHDGTEGELYNLTDDPMQHNNLFHDAANVSVRKRLFDLLQANLPPKGPQLERLTPV
jgi:hypothetical protein